MKHPRLNLIIIFLLLLSGGLCLGLDHGIVRFKGHSFFVEVAQTADEKTQGLMFREHLDRDKGMLFVYKKEGRHSFWMKNTLIPLDIIWIDKEKIVVFIARDMQPSDKKPYSKIRPKAKAKYVLELNTGTAERIGLAKGDKLEFDIGN